MLCILGTCKPHHQLSKVEANAPAERRATASEPSSRSERTMMPPEVRRTGRIRKDIVSRGVLIDIDRIVWASWSKLLSPSLYQHHPLLWKAPNHLSWATWPNTQQLSTWSWHSWHFPPRDLTSSIAELNNYKWLDEVSKTLLGILIMVAKLLIASRCLAQMPRLSWARNGYLPQENNSTYIYLHLLTLVLSLSLSIPAIYQVYFFS